MSKLEDLRRVHLASVEMPAKLQAARERLYSLKTQADIAVGAVEDSEADELAMVSAIMTEATIDAKGKSIEPKPVFSNKEAREAEVRHRLGQSKRHQGLLEEQRTALDAKSAAERDLQRLIDEDKSLDRQLDAICAAVRSDTLGALTSALVQLAIVEGRGKDVHA